MNMCIVEGCNNKAIAKGYCSKHYTQLRRYGKIFQYSYRDKTNHIEICGKCLIDLEDVELVKNIKWHKSDLQRSTYYCTSSNKTWKRIHRLILNVTDPNVVVDHINHNGLDNRKCNLRVCTNQQNICNCKVPKNNKSGIKGVYWAKDKNKWTVQVSINNKTKYIGRYSDFNEAVQARIKAEKEYYGEFANQTC